MRLLCSYVEMLRPQLTSNRELWPSSSAAERLLGLECVDTLAPGLRFERYIRRGTTYFTLQTTPVAFCSLAFCSIQPLMTGTIGLSACPLYIYLWRGKLDVHLT